MHTNPDNMSFHVTCPFLNELLKYAVTSDQAGENRPNIPCLSETMHAYAQSLPTDHHLVPLPDNGELMVEWLEGVASGQGRRLYLMPSFEFAERYPTRATLKPKSPMPPTRADDALIAARA
jgi:hypothetical protein